MRKKELVEYFLAKGADIKAVDGKKNTALHLAMHKPYSSKPDADYSGVVEVLISKGLDVNVKGESGWTPLHEAIEEGVIDRARLLISKGADVNAKSDYNITPLHLASREGDIDMVNMLLASGADINAKSKDKPLLHSL